MLPSRCARCIAPSPGRGWGSDPCLWPVRRNAECAASRELGVLQRVAACCSVLQRVAVCYSLLQRVAAGRPVGCSGSAASPSPAVRQRHGAALWGRGEMREAKMPEAHMPAPRPSPPGPCSASLRVQAAARASVVIERKRQGSIVGSFGPLHGPCRQRSHASPGQPDRPEGENQLSPTTSHLGPCRRRTFRRTNQMCSTSSLRLRRRHHRLPGIHRRHSDRQAATLRGSGPVSGPVVGRA